MHLLYRKDNLPSAREPALLLIASLSLPLPLSPRDAAVKKLAYVHAVCSDKDSVPTAPSSTIEASPAGPRLHRFVPCFHCLPPTAFTKCKGAVPHCSGPVPSRAPSSSSSSSCSPSSWWVGGGCGSRAVPIAPWSAAAGDGRCEVLGGGDAAALCGCRRHSLDW